MATYNKRGYKPAKEKEVKEVTEDINVLEKILTDGFNSVVGKHLDYKTNTWQDTK